MGIRLVLATLGLGLVALAPRVRRARHPGRLDAARLAALAVTGALAFASYYNFFQVRHHEGLKDTDVFHYYMGSKYFKELGYLDLYNCSVRVLSDAGELSRFDLPAVRDMRTLQLQTEEQTLARSYHCPEQFSPARWSAFERDVLWFARHFSPGRWPLVLRDHGFHPTPVWSFLGAQLAKAAPLGSTRFQALLLADRALMLLAMGFIAWAFGLEAAIVALIVWGTGHHWGYAWIGDAMLRTLWLCALLCGLCLLRKGRFAASGALIAFSALLRIFPAIFIAGFGVHALLRTWKERAIDRETRQFFFGVIAMSAVLLLGSVLFGGRGFAAYGELAQKMSLFSAHPSSNKLGLSTDIWRVVMTSAGQLSVDPSGALVIAEPATATLKLWMRGLQLLVLIPALLLYGRALRRVDGFEATLLAAAWIPLLSSPTNYYYGFLLVVVMWPNRVTLLRSMLLALSALWIALGMVFDRDPTEYLWAGVLAVMFSVALIALAAFGPDRREPQGDSAAIGDGLAARAGS